MRVVGFVMLALISSNCFRAFLSRGIKSSISRLVPSNIGKLSGGQKVAVADRNKISVSVKQVSTTRSREKKGAYVESEKSDDWNRWEFGTFRTSPDQKDCDNSTPAIAASSSVHASKHVDPLWSDLTDEEVKFGINTLADFCSEERRVKMQQVLDQRTANIRVVFENPSNANNMWAALRTFDSFGIQFTDIIIDDSCYFNTWRSNTMKTALGSQKWLTLQEHSSTADCIDHFRSMGYRIYASDLHGSSKSIHDIDWIHSASPLKQTPTSDDASYTTTSDAASTDAIATSVTDTMTHKVTTADSIEDSRQKIVIVMGNEERGITDVMRKHADGLFYIPMKGFAESLNLSVASAVLCAILESKGALFPDLSAATKDRILLTWLLRSVKGSLPILRRAGLNIEGSSRYNKIGNVTTNP